MSVDVTYCLDEWEKYFTEKPLSFKGFVEIYQQKEKIFPHILEKINVISNNPQYIEFFIQGFVGSGKSTLIYLLTAYKVYLFLLLKSPHELYGLSDDGKFFVMFYLPDKRYAELLIYAFINLLKDFPFFKEVKNLQEPDLDNNVISFKTFESDDLLTFKKHNTFLHVKAAKNKYDLYGACVIMCIISEIGPLRKRGVSSSEIFKFYKNVKHLIKSRYSGPVNAIIVDKDPDNYYTDVFDRYISEHVQDSPTEMSITFQNYWELFRNLDPDSKIDSIFNLTTCRVVDNMDDVLPGDNFIRFPSIFNNVNFLDKAKKCPKRFVNEVIGQPVCMNTCSPTYDAMVQVIDLINKHNLEISYKNGKVYLEQPDEKLILELDNSVLI